MVAEVKVENKAKTTTGNSQKGRSSQLCQQLSCRVRPRECQVGKRRQGIGRNGNNKIVPFCSLHPKEELLSD